MRTLIFLAYFLASTVVVFAQETETETAEKQKTDLKWHFGVGMSSNPDYNINDKLLASGNHRISDFVPTAVVGWSINLKRYTIELEGGFSGFWKKDDGYRLSQVPLALRGKYTVIDGEKFSIAAGAGITFVGSDLAIYSENAVIDMNDLNPDNNSGYIRLRNSSWFASPSLSFALGKFTGKETRLILGYDIAISNTKWKADYGHISNPVRENGNRFFIGFQYPF